jgi:hypothetical protein
VSELPNVLIRDVDTDTYNNFKAKAAQKGLKLGDAITKAMQEWLENNKIITERDRQRQDNLLTYRKLKDTLNKEYKGKWVLIGRGELITSSNNLNLITERINELNLQGEHCYVFQVGKEIKRRSFGLGRRVQK